MVIKGHKSHCYWVKQYSYTLIFRMIYASLIIFYDAYTQTSMRALGGHCGRSTVHINRWDLRSGQFK